MRRIIILIILAFFVIQTKAQIENMNPDPEGDPWITGGVKEPSSQDLSEINAIPRLQLTTASENTTLPSTVDNSTLDYWPGIDNQGYFPSCAQFAGIYYTFTYEINRVRNIATTSENTYHHHYTWNFLNNGTNNGSLTTDGWDIVMENGCPTQPAFGADNVGNKKWMSGYDKYYQAQHNKVDSYYQIQIFDEADLIELKHWIHDHNAGASTGGLAVFYCNTGMTIESLPPESQHTGDGIVTQFGVNGGHAMTIVGYNDDIMYDFNGDGQFTNNVDINNDGEIDIQDWEIGAVKVANSWGNNWEEDGYVYVPYRLLGTGEPGGGIWGHRTYVMNAKASYSPDITFKTTVDHSTRCNVQYRVGYGLSSISQNPDEITNFSSFNYQGGAYPMQGTNSDPLENSLDFSHWYPSQSFGKLFLQIIDNSNGTFPDGEIKSFSVIDYRFGEEFEIECPVNNVEIEPGDTTQLAIDYHLFPFNVNSDKTIESDRIVRLNPVIAANTTVTIEQGVQLDFYNSNLTVEEGATLILKDNVEIHSKEGNSHLIVHGDIQTGQNIKFNGLDSDNLMVFNPHNQTTQIQNCQFKNALIKGGARSLTLDSCELDIASVEYIDGENLVIKNSNINKGYIYVSRTGSKCGAITIENNSIINTNFPYGPSIRIEGYPSLRINDNEIYFQKGTGLSVQYSGSACYQREIVNNTINYEGSSSDTTYGIELQRSNLIVKNNYITDAKCGIVSGDNNYVSIEGNSNASSVTETQRIVDNTVYQVYAAANSFPYYSEYNAIYGSGSPYVYYTGSDSPLDVENNYWGSGFDPGDDLYPSGAYDYQPIWNPGGGQKAAQSQDEALVWYQQALDYIATGAYAEAESKLKAIVNQYPQTKQANAALGSLLSLEKLSKENYEELQSYFMEDESINSYESLSETAEDLANWCDVYAGNYEEAIAYFEDIILNSNDEDEVIYAEIDLAYTYLLMEEEGNTKTNGKLSNRRPESYATFQKRRSKLVKELLKSNENEQTNKVFTERSNPVHVYPNPSKGNVNFEFSLNNPAHVSLRILNTQGQQMDKINRQKMDSGIHTINWNNSSGLNGIYFYELKMNDKMYKGKLVVL